jgi:hypothetical protein
MAQGFTNPAALSKVQTMFGDSANLDSYGRLRVANPTSVFEAQMTYGLAPLRFEQITNGSGATITHDTTNRCALMTFSSTPTGGKAYMQSFAHHRYQAGRGQYALITFNFIETMANTLKFVGYSDGTNGVELQQSGSTVQFKLYSATSNGDQTVAKESWNLDVMDGTGPSGLTLDLTKAQILVIDLQSLYVGRIRVGFDIGGTIFYVHQFVHANLITVPYFQSANLPIRAGMTCTGTVSTTMRFICNSVLSEGGEIDVGGRDFAIWGSVTAGSGSDTHILSIRPKATFNSFTNRVKFALDSLEVLAGANPVQWKLCLGQAISGTTTFADVDTNYSAFEFNTAGTVSGSPAIVIASGYVGSSNTTKGSTSSTFDSNYPITLDAAGAVRALGTLTVLVSGITGSSATQVALNWKEIR